MPLTGFLGAIGGYAQLGAKLAAEEINAAGGIMGKPLEAMSELNVTPLIDLAFALLIIFMITAPLLQQKYWCWEPPIGKMWEIPGTAALS